MTDYVDGSVVPGPQTMPLEGIRMFWGRNKLLGVYYEFAGGTAAFLYESPNAATSKASQAFWHIDDIEREVAELKARGIAFEDYDLPGSKSASGVLPAFGAKAAWFTDTEGSILEDA